MKRGRLIVFEGTNGSGKTTQAKLLMNRLKRMKRKVAFIHFPQYETKAGGLIENYLTGKYGQINAYQASTLYAADRFDGGFYIKRRLKEGYIVLADRYVASNIGHQGGKIHSAREREKFFRWLYELEYNLFKIPKPSISFLLKVAPSSAQKLLRKSGKKLDIHEKNFRHAKGADRAYSHAAKLFPQNFKIVNCMSKKTLRSPADIHEEVWQKIQKLL
jgi:dTMP kinase